MAILFPKYSVSQSIPSGPVMITFGSLLDTGSTNWLVTSPSVIMRATLLLKYSVYQIAPSGPVVRS